VEEAVILCFLVHGSQLEYKTPLAKSPLSKYLCGHGKNSRENVGVILQSMDFYCIGFRALSEEESS
jgi:hypothetical protein